MLNKENYIPWLSRLLRYAKSRPNGKLIHNSILNGPCIRKIIPEPGDANHDINITETSHLQTNDELSNKELKQIEADDQAIQTILLGLPKAMQTQIDMVKNELRNEMKTSIQTSLSNQTNEIKNLMASLLQLNTASTSSLGTLPSNTVANPKSDLKAITTQSEVSYDGPSIPPPVVENEPEATKDIVIPTNNGITEDVQPQAVQSKLVTFEPANTPVSASKPNPQALIPYPSRRIDERNREKAKDQIEKFYQIFKDMSFEISFVNALILMPKFASTLKALIGNKEKLSEMARTLLNEHYSAVLLKKLPEKLGDPGKFLIMCDFPGMAECLALADLELADRLISQPVGVAEDAYVNVGSFHFPTDFVVVDFDADPRVPLILGRSFLKTIRALIDVFKGELTLRVGKVAITFNLDQTSRLFRMLFRILRFRMLETRMQMEIKIRLGMVVLWQHVLREMQLGIQLQAEEYDLMVAAADLDDIKEVNANCILMANLQQASTSGTQSDSTPVYDTDGSAEVHKNYDDNEIFNMFTQDE
nr:reverse transcriptase domain-containing protein [Tanacetum cinerariifolium]